MCPAYLLRCTITSTRAESDCYMVKRACVPHWPGVVVQDRTSVGDPPAYSTLQSPIPQSAQIFGWRAMKVRDWVAAEIIRMKQRPMCKGYGGGNGNGNNELFRVLSK